MRMNRSVVGLLGFGAAAFAAGHFGLLRNGSPGAWAEPEKAGQEPAPAQEAEAEAAREPVSPEHDQLNALAGEWEGVFKIWSSADAPPMISEGTITREWVLDARFMKERVTATSLWGEFEGLAYIGYNDVDGQYEFVWMENLSNPMYFWAGVFDDDRKVLITRGTHRDAAGHIIHNRSELDYTDPDRHVYVTWSMGPDGREYKSFEGVARRK